MRINSTTTKLSNQVVLKMLDQGSTLDELCNSLHRSESSVLAVFNGDKKLTRRFAIELAEYFNDDVNEWIAFA